jgi:hypothetical protein
MSQKMYKITLCGSEAHNEIKIELNNVEANAAEKIFKKLRTEGTKDEYAPMPYIEEIAVIKTKTHCIKTVGFLFFIYLFLNKKKGSPLKNT